MGKSTILEDMEMRKSVSVDIYKSEQSEERVLRGSGR